MGKWTPGPWQAGRPDMATIVDGYSSKWIYGGEKGDGIAIASGRNVEDWDEVMANASLIAASPSLAEALANLVALLPDPELDRDEVQRGYVIKARAALKAAGVEE